MTTPDTPATPHQVHSDDHPARGRASYSRGYTKGVSTAHALAQGGEGNPAGARARAHGDQPDLRHQGVPQEGEEPQHAAADVVPTANTTAPRDRRPRRRPYKPKRREDVIAVRFSADEKAEIVDAAARRRAYPSGFLATAGLAVARGASGPDANDQLDGAIDELAALRAQISRVGNNINQIAYVYNSGGQPRPGQLDHALTALRSTLAEVDTAAHHLVRRHT